MRLQFQLVLSSLKNWAAMPDLTIKSISHPQTNFAPTTMTAAMFLSGLLSHFYRENMFRKLRGFSLHVFESTQK